MNITPFNYNGVIIKESCMVADKPYFTRKAIGEWLGASNPQKYVDNILDRNPYIRQFSVTLNLRGTDGKQYPTEVYDAIGLQLIVMESHLPKAIQYKIAVARLVSDIMSGKFLDNLVLGYLRGEVKLIF